MPASKNIGIIADCANGHSVGNHGQRLLDNDLKDVRKWIEVNSANREIMHNRRVQFLLQPAQSPDLSTLDLGACRSLKTDVNALRYDPECFFGKISPLNYWQI